MKKFAGIVLAATMGGAITLGLYQLVEPAKQEVIRVEHTNAVPSHSSRFGGTEAAPFDFTGPAEVVMPTVVHIKSTQIRPAGNTQQIPDLFRDFFGDQLPDQGRMGRPQPAVGTGSGVIISQDGYIVTNNHVIDGADDVEVSLNDNRTYKAEIIGTDPSTDLALIKIDEAGLEAVQIGNSDATKVGQWVLAIGNPFSLNSTVTAGIVSAKGRNINILRDRAAIESFIQTDAAVNPGNSGGALVNMDGELIGINTAIASPTGSYSGYAFAVPSNLMRKVIEDLMQFGVVQRGFLGINIRNVDGNLARENDLDLTEGVWVENVQENSAAADAGLVKGDVITAINGKSVKTVAELQSAIGTRRPGDAVNVDFTRDGKVETAEVVLKNKSGNTDVVKREESGLAQRLGAEFENVDGDTLDKLNLKYGVRLKTLMPGKLRSSTDIQEGFIITHIGGEVVKDVEQLEKMLAKKKGGVMLEGRYEDYPGTQYYAFGL